jgi:hypothetical protein
MAAYPPRSQLQRPARSQCGFGAQGDLFTEAAVVALDRIEPTNLSATDVLNAMRGLGVGLAGAARQ